MGYQIDLRSFFLLVAAFQALVFSFLLLVRSAKRNSLSDKLLALFLISLTATLSEHIAGWMGWYKSQQLTFFPFGNHFLFTPLAYLYVKSITNSSFKVLRRDSLHFIPAAIYFAFHVAVWLMPVDHKLSFLSRLGANNYYLFEGVCDMLVLSIYTSLSILHYRAYLGWLPSEFSNTRPLELVLLRNFLVILFVVCLVELAFSISSLFYSYWYDVRYWDYFIRAILLYYLSIAGYTSTRPVELAFANEIQPDITTNIAEPLPMQRLADFMTSQKPYLDPELTLKQLAGRVELPTQLVSQTINIGLHKNFNDFVNEHRVQEICARLKMGEHKTKTLLGVGLDCGFNSKATFNRSFKKVMGLSPKEWLEGQNS